MQKLSSLRHFLLASLAILPTTLSSPLIHAEKRDGDVIQPLFAFASIGDSWAAGQGVTADNAYGGPSQFSDCFRHKASWEALMAGDNTWTNDPIDFKFAACSGAVLEDATTGSNSQIPQVAKPELLTVQLGGNNAHFGDIVKDCVYVGDLTIQKDYPDPKGACFGTINEWESYIDAPVSAGNQKSLQFDHQQTMQDILNSAAFTGRDDFYIAVVGYGEFFNLKSPDSDWCNDVSFGIYKSPKLSNVLRTKLNELSRKANAAIAASVQSLQNERFIFFDPSALVENHRFCEPGHKKSNEYFLNDVWFWNISPPDQDLAYAALSDTDPHKTAWAENYTFINGTQATSDQLLELLGGNVSGSGSGRAFHPKDGGHLAIKNGVIGFLRENNVPGVKPAAPPPPPPKKQPYASGQMQIHINEYWDCHDDSENLSVEVTMWDGAGVQIGHLARTQAGALASARMGSKLEDVLVITPEWAQGGYIQFQLGALGFNTKDDTDHSKPVYCNWGGFDPSQGPPCIIQGPDGPIPNPTGIAKNQVDCWFPSPVWNGGNPSDGSSL